MIRTRDWNRWLALFAILGTLLPAAAGRSQAQEATPRSGSVALSLEQAVELALGSDEQILQMTERIQGARADLMSANSGRLPQLDVAGSWTRNLKKPSFFLPAGMAAGFGGASSVEMGGDWDLQAAASLSWNLWTAGRLSSARALAEEGVEATRRQKALVRDAVRYNVTAAYNDVLLAHLRARIAKESLDLATESHRVTQASYDEGRTSRFDLLRAEVELTNREAPLVQARNEYRLAELALLRACGLDPGTQLTLLTDLAEVPAPEAESGLLTRMRSQSPELQALEHGLKAARWSVSLAKAARGPIVQLQGTYALQGQWDDDLFPGSDEAVSSASAALAFSVPIFDGYSTKASILGSEADLRVAEIEFERTLRDRELGVRQARTNLENALLALEGRHEGVELATEAHRLADIRKENGLATPLEQMDAQLALTEARLQLAQALYSCNIAAAALDLAVGGNEEK